MPGMDICVWCCCCDSSRNVRWPDFITDVCAMWFVCLCTCVFCVRLQIPCPFCALYLNFSISYIAVYFFVPLDTAYRFFFFFYSLFLPLVMSSTKLTCSVTDSLTHSHGHGRAIKQDAVDRLIEMCDITVQLQRVPINRQSKNTLMLKKNAENKLHTL